MYAQDLRKWRPVFMYLSIPLYLILFSVLGLSASAMHLTPVSSQSAHRSDWLRSPRHGLQRAGSQLHQQEAAVTSSQQPQSPNSNLLDSLLRSRAGSHLALSNNSSISSSSSSSSSSSNQITYLHQISRSVPSSSFSRSSMSTMKSSLASLPPTVPALGLSKQNEAFINWRRRVWDQKHAKPDDMTVRDRRDSQHNKKRKKRRYCSAQDPSALAFEAPTVIEAKIKSRSSDRRYNFSVTFEHIKTYKHDPGYSIPKNFRLTFINSNRTVCNIYKEDYRERGLVKRPLNLSGHYFLFLKQLDLGNFTILGSPIPKDVNSERAVKHSVRNRHGKSFA